MEFVIFTVYAVGMNGKETLSKLLSIDSEIDRRKSEPLANYNKDVIHEKQMAFHKCGKRNRWVFGGNRSGKTECGAVECVWMALGIHPYRENRKDTTGWVVSLSQQVQRDVAQAKILKYLPKRYVSEVVMREGKQSSYEYGVIDYILVKNVFGGISRIGFKSCDQGREKFQGTSLDYVWFDEEPPKDVYEECRMRVFDKVGDVFGTMTPLKGLTWVYDEIYMNINEDPEVWCEFVEWKDNPYLDKDEVKNMEKIIPKSAQESRRFGKFSSGEGLVYREFDESVHVIEPFEIPYDWQADISIDPGLRNPTSCHFYAVDYDGVIYVVAEHFEAEQNVAYHAKKIGEIADELGWQRDKFGRLHALIDSAANQHTMVSDKSVAEVFREQGILVNTNVNKDVYSGIQRIKCLLEQKRLFIFSCCPNLIREMKAYVYGAGDKPKKVDDHALDELRYFVMSQPDVPSPPKPQKSEISLDKERLIRMSERNRKWTRN